MPRRQPNPHLFLEDGLRRLRNDTDAVQRQQQTVIVDPSEATGDPTQNWAILVIGYLNDVTGIPGWGVAVWDEGTMAWVQLPGTGGSFKFSQTYAWTGLVLTTAGATGYFPPTYIPVLGGTTCDLVAVKYAIRGGTNATFTVNHNGSAISGMTGLTATTTPALTSFTTSIADGDAVNIDVTGGAGGPDGLSVSLYFEVTP
jgi:hypothetical protein